jgi:hypothetical protein
MWERLRRRTEPTEEVVALVDQGGVLVTGPRGAIDTIVARLTGVHGARSLRAAADPAAAIASAVASVGTGQEYVRLSPDSWELLRQHGAIPGEAGYFRMFVHDSAKKIAGQLQWEKVNLGAEQALSLQVSAVSLVLRAAILDVQQSVERVEAKLDQVTKLLRAERRGDALGDHRTLTTLTDRVRRSGQISVADWSSVAAMGPEIGRDLEGLRAHVRSLLERDRPGRMPWRRAGEAEQLLEEDWLEETLALLAVVEHNFALWQELRIAHVSVDEQRHLADTVDDARRQMEHQRQADQQLLDALVVFATDVADPRVLDGLDPLNANRLVRARDELDKVVQWFAAQRLLDAAPLAAEPFPKFRDSVRHLASSTSRGVATASTALLGAVRRSKEPDQPALPPGPVEPDD